MQIKNRRALIALLVGSVLIAIAFFYMPSATGQSYDKGAVVKLYSGNRLVATWTAVSMGHADGNTFVFNVGSTTSPAEVRICGTYTVERIP